MGVKSGFFTLDIINRKPDCNQNGKGYGSRINWKKYLTGNLIFSKVKSTRNDSRFYPIP